MSEKAGLRKHGLAAEDALLREFTQLEDLSVFTPLLANTLTHEQRKGALRAINLIKEKRDGTLKGRTVADGRPQRDLYEKGQTTSPTVSSDALLTTIMIDAKEGRDVATADVAGAYLKADMDEFVLLRFTGKAVDIMCKMDAKYKNYTTTEHGKIALYMRLDKALYGCVHSALLWYNLFSETLVSFGFSLNPYDQCVANSDIDGSQCTIAWYVDDTKISHRDPTVVSRVIANIESRLGKMAVTRGDKHVFLGMNLTYNRDGTATIEMREHLQEAVAYSGLDINRSVLTPAQRFLFDADDSSPRLVAARADAFHRTTAKLLYIATRARMDILLPVCFLCTRVSVCTEGDEAKLRRVLHYLYGTMDLTYNIGANSLNKIHTWVDASYAVHPDMRSHTGGLMSFGIGGLVCKSTKQKLNTKSSTEAELVGASDYLPNTLWMKMFLEAQGYRVTDNVFEQDNESAIRLEKNGRSSAGPRSRHIDIRYFFIKDKIQAEQITVWHCPTTKMLADFFTKPLQGSLFYKLRSVIMGHKHVNTLQTDLLPPGEERVGKIGDVRTKSYVENESDVGHNSSEQRTDISIAVSDESRKKGFGARDHSLETIPV